MVITPADLEHVAKLAKFELTEGQQQYVLTRISSILDYTQQLQEVDVTGVEPTTHVLQLTNVFREDKAAPCLPREEALSIAPEHEGGYFKVPSIL